VDFQLGIGIAADLAAAIDSILLGVEVAAKPTATATPHFPSTAGIWNDMVRSACILTFRHLLSPLLKIGRPHQAATRDENQVRPSRATRDG
jgi:hypothetical protein